MRREEQAPPLPMNIKITIKPVGTVRPYLLRKLTVQGRFVNRPYKQNIKHLTKSVGVGAFDDPKKRGDNILPYRRILRQPLNP